MKAPKRPVKNLIAGDIFTPGSYIAEELAARKMKQAELAAMLGLSRPEMSLIINGKRGITVPVAIKLEVLLGIDAEFWMTLQVKYDIARVRQQATA